MKNKIGISREIF